MNIPRFFWRLWALAALALVALTPLGVAARDNVDDGEYQILQANYGTAARHVDVTPRLKELARSDRMFRANNDTLLTDPDPGQVKTLRIYTRGRDGKNRSFDYPEGSMVDGARFTAWQSGNWGQGGWQGGWGDGSRDDADRGEYQILQANYGTPEHHVDVTGRLKELARQDLRFNMGNNTFGVDPDPGRVKTLRIYTQGRSGQQRTFEYREGAVVDGALFTGWAKGSWGNGGWSGGWGDHDGHHRDRDEGQFEIQRALYGTADAHVDVTRQLKELARADSKIVAGNSVFGVDPAPGLAKTLRLYTKGPRGESRMFEYPEGYTVDGARFTAWSAGHWGHGGDQGGGWHSQGPSQPHGNAPNGELRIVKASYGTAYQQQDVTARLRALASAWQLNITANNGTVGFDPAPGSRKTLWVTYTMGNGPVQQRQVNEDERLIVP